MREHSRDRGRLEDIVKYAQNVNVIISGILNPPCFGEKIVRKVCRLRKLFVYLR